MGIPVKIKNKYSVGSQIGGMGKKMKEASVEINTLVEKWSN